MRIHPKISKAHSVAFVFIIAVASLALAMPTNGQRQRSRSALVIKNAMVMDVVAGSVGTEKVDVLIVDGRIDSIGPNIDADGRIPMVDIDGRVLMPGMIDLHSHLLLHPYDEASWNEQVLNESLGLRTIRGTVAAQKTLEAGFTTLRDLGTEGAGYADVALRDAIDQGIIPGPRVFAVTKAMVTTGGYGPMGFDPRWKMPVGAQVADGVAECRRVTREQIAAGADWIKIYADYRRKPGSRSTATFSTEELKAIVDEATTAGVPVAAHAVTDEGIRRSVEAGVLTIEHGYEASPETLEFMNQRGVVLCPTLAASESMARYQGWNPETDPEHPRVTQSKTLMRNAINANVTIACGSDVGVFSHGDNFRELELMFAYGMRPDKVVRSATSTAAQVLQQDDLGEVKEGFIADLIVVGKDPTRNLATLARPFMVIKDGRVAVNRLAPVVRPRSNSTSTSTDLTSEERTPETAGQKKPMELSRPANADRVTEQPDSRPTTPKEAKPAEKEVVPARREPGQFTFRINSDRTYSVAGEVVSRQRLSELVAEAVEAGKSNIRIVAPKDVGLSAVAAEQAWLRTLNVTSVEIKIEK